MTKILFLSNKRVFKGLFIHLIGCEHDQDLGPYVFSHVFKQVGHWSTYLEKNALCDMTMLLTRRGPQRSAGEAEAAAEQAPGPGRGRRHDRAARRHGRGRRHGRAARRAVCGRRSDFEHGPIFIFATGKV